MNQSPCVAGQPGSTAWIEQDRLTGIDDAAPEVRTLRLRQQRPGCGIANRISMLLPQYLDPGRVGQHGRCRPGSTTARQLRTIEVAQQLARESPIWSDRRYAFGERAEYCWGHGRHGSRSSRIAGVSTLAIARVGLQTPERAQRSITVEAGQWQLTYWSTARSPIRALRGYKKLAEAAIAKHGGRYRREGVRAHCLGHPTAQPHRRPGISTFDRAKAFYDSTEYLPRAARAGAADMTMVVVAGL
jgi:uncharacterized protein (DUF1330 family)